MSRPNGKENSPSEEVGQREKVVPPTMTGVSGNSPVPLQRSPEKGGETESKMQTASPLTSQQTEGHRELSRSLCASEVLCYR